MDTIKELSNKIKEANHIVFLTGAGVSTASGIPDFRSAGGIWEEDKDREYYMSSDYFSLNPIDFWVKYKSIFQMKLLGTYSPNVTHEFIRELETKGATVSVITQNVDGLHAKAGSQQVVEYHGSLTTATCTICHSKYDLAYVLSNETPTCRDCDEILKPDVVLFGDPITQHDRSEAIIDTADLVIVLGTSLFVMPFNFLPEYASWNRGIPTAIINREPTPKDYVFDYVIHDDLIAVVKKLKAHLD